MAESKSTQTLKIVPNRAEPQGLNAGQYAMVCADIALRADTLCRLLSLIEQNRGSDDWEHQTHIEAALSIAERIGAMADSARGPLGPVVGDIDHWLYGPGFESAGKEVQHG